MTFLISHFHALKKPTYKNLYLWVWLLEYTIFLQWEGGWLDIWSELPQAMNTGPRYCFVFSGLWGCLTSSSESSKCKLMTQGFVLSFAVLTGLSHWLKSRSGFPWSMNFPQTSYLFLFTNNIALVCIHFSFWC